MYEVIAYSNTHIYVLDKRNNNLTAQMLYHSPSQIANDFAGVPKVLNRDEAEKLVKVGKDIN